MLQAGKITGVSRACAAVGWSRATFYRMVQAKQTLPLSKPAPGRAGRKRAITAGEEEQILDVLNSERFLNASCREVWATLLDEGLYYCSWRSMYRILSRHHEVKERRDVRRHLHYVRPELMASGPNQVWTWDITYLKGPDRREFFYLYVVIDIYSRLVVGWLLADRECEKLARHLLETTYRKQGVIPGQLTVHADRGASMKSKTVKELLCDLKVSVSHSRPRVSNDNPFSEAAFKTIKYSPDFPSRFGSIEEAMRFCKLYFDWYNNRHHHSGIADFTPAQVHYGEIESVIAARQQALHTACLQHPERFSRGCPVVRRPPEIVYINRPAEAVCGAAA